MFKFTFDTNCLIDLDEKRPSAEHIRDLIRAHRAGRCEVALVAVSASERQPGDRYLETFAEFEARLSKLKIEDIPTILGMAYSDFSYLDHAVWADETCDLEERIHHVLFPTTPFKYSDFLVANETSTGDIKTDKAWRNKWCDRQMIWAHISNNRDVFVTSDMNFDRIVGKTGFETVQVMRPEEAAALLPR